MLLFGQAEALNLFLESSDGGLADDSLAALAEACLVYCAGTAGACYMEIGPNGYDMGSCFMVQSDGRA